MRLLDYARDLHSQNGEDGIISKIFEIIQPETRVAIEFGAWDGFHLSNTASLWTTQGWRGVLIEGEPNRFEELLRRTASYDVKGLCAFVGVGPEDSLEAILGKAGVELKADLLSIDIDGDDLHILASLERLRPLVIVCEYNPHIPFFIDLYAQKGQRFGASVAALIRAARGLGYRLVALTKTNAFFVREEHFGRFEAFETSVEQLAGWDNVSFVIQDYDGNYVIARPPGERWVVRAPISYPLVGRPSEQELDSAVLLVSKTSLAVNAMRLPRAVFRWLPPDVQRRLRHRLKADGK
jgi:hypothetical protein